jgi:hypothetical protein
MSPARVPNTRASVSADARLHHYPKGAHYYRRSVSERDDSPSHAAQMAELRAMRPRFDENGQIIMVPPASTHVIRGNDTIRICHSCFFFALMC